MELKNNRAILFNGADVNAKLPHMLQVDVGDGRYDWQVQMLTGVIRSVR